MQIFQNYGKRDIKLRNKDHAFNGPFSVSNFHHRLIISEPT